MKKTVGFIFLLILSLTRVPAQEKTGDYVLGKGKRLFSRVLNEERTYQVYLPGEYRETENKYPLLISLDGYFLWPAGIVDYLSYSGNVPPMIIVSIENVDRDRDFTPTRSRNLEGEEMPTSGGAAKFLEFLEKELIPAIESEYRVESFRMLAGHSMSALFVTYVLLEAPELFQAYFAASPTLPWDGEWAVTQAQTALRDEYRRNTFFYLAMDQQAGPMLEAARRLTEEAGKKSRENLYWKFKRYEHEDHISCYFIAFYEALRDLYAPFKISEQLITSADAGGIENHYNGLTRRYGYPIVPAWNWLDWIANWHLLMNRYQEAAGLYKLGVKYYPRSADAHIRLADALEKGGDLPGAVASLERALAFIGDESEKGGINERIEKLRKAMRR